MLVTFQSSPRQIGYKGFSASYEGNLVFKAERQVRNCNNITKHINVNRPIAQRFVVGI
jgi:hypothetical protein